MMHDLRSAILSGEGVRKESPVASGKRKKLTEPSLVKIAVKREESRLTDHRREQRHRGIVEEALLFFRRRQHEVRVVNVSSGGIMVEAGIAPRIGELLEIQFADCNRTRCALRWVREGRLGLEFLEETTIIGSRSVQGFVIAHLRGEAAPEAPDAKPNRTPRHGLVWSGTIHFEHESVPARVRNISAEGAMIECAHGFDLGHEVLLDLDHGLTAFATVRWARGGQIGLKFDRKFDLRRLVEAKPQQPPKFEVVMPAVEPTDQSWASQWERRMRR